MLGDQQDIVHRERGGRERGDTYCVLKRPPMKATAQSAISVTYRRRETPASWLKKSPASQASPLVGRSELQTPATMRDSSHHTWGKAFSTRGQERGGGVEWEKIQGREERRQHL